MEKKDQDELARLREENARLQKAAALTYKVGEKGGLSVGGLGRFPVTLYADQWERLLAAANDIRAALSRFEGQLKVKKAS